MGKTSRPVQSLHKVNATNIFPSLGRASQSIMFSVIMVVYNGIRFISEAFNSIVNQDFDSYELVIIDGGSTDGTLEFLKENERSITQLISEKDQGIYYAMNKGLQVSRGDYIVFINSDDYLLPGALKQLSQEIAMIPFENRSRAMLCHAVKKVNFKGETLFILRKDEVFFKRNMFYEMPVNHQGLFVHRNLFESLGFFDTSFRIAADYEFVIRAYFSGAADLYFYNFAVSAMRTGGVSESISFLFLRNMETLRIIRVYGNFSVRLFIMILVKFIIDFIVAILKNILPNILIQKYHRLRHGALNE
jgi:glycosyltransferase involved in cell wall biosynthesis